MLSDDVSPCPPAPVARRGWGRVLDVIARPCRHRAASRCTSRPGRRVRPCRVAGEREPSRWHRRSDAPHPLDRRGRAWRTLGRGQDLVARLAAVAGIERVDARKRDRRTIVQPGRSSAAPDRAQPDRTRLRHVGVHELEQHRCRWWRPPANRPYGEIEAVTLALRSARICSRSLWLKSPTPLLVTISAA